jgi:hypothetical protein
MQLKGKSEVKVIDAANQSHYKQLDIGFPADKMVKTLIQDKQNAANVKIRNFGNQYRLELLFLFLFLCFYLLFVFPVDNPQLV